MSSFFGISHFAVLVGMTHLAVTVETDLLEAYTAYASQA